MTKDSANLDFLRASAVLTVYVAHLIQMAGIRAVGPFTLNGIAQMAVLIFFVHTSLVLMLSMDRMKVPAATLFKAFYIRRAFRIYPLSIATVLLAVVFTIPPFPIRPYVWPGWYHFASNLLLAQNLTFSPSLIGPLWSLPYEVQMYLLLPPLYLLVKAVPAWWVPVGLWALAVLCAPLQKATISRQSLMQYAPCFLGGVLAFVLASRPAFRLPFWGWPLMIGIAFLIRQIGFQAGWVACLLLGASIPQFAELGDGWLRKAAAWIAKYSYGIYLSHVIIFWIAFILLRGYPGWVQAAVCAVLSVTVPVAMYHAIEHPAILAAVKLADRFSPNSQTALCEVAAAVDANSMNVDGLQPGMRPRLQQEAARRGA